ncbi:hypothetical protein IJ182_06295 [bacterium]|nr:hypothetical protein [bacterium]
MAKIIENKKGRRCIKLGVEDIIDVVREYQNITYNCSNSEEIRLNLKNYDIVLPEDID